MDKYQNKYHIPSARLQNWDYGANGAYFITICTHNREHFFGKISNSTMHLSEVGFLAQKYWSEIPKHFPFVELGNFVIMPNHTHGILIIDRCPDSVETLHRNVSRHCNVSVHNCNESTNAGSNVNAGKNERLAKISPVPGSVSTIIRSYKSVVSKNARLIHADFAWQTRFYDHIIRNVQAFETIQNYIADNPLNWEKDKFYN